MAVLGMPTAMFLVFFATLLAGSVAAIHYTVVHVLLGRPVEGASTTSAGEGER